MSFAQPIRHHEQGADSTTFSEETSPRPQWYISRGAGNFVPMIAVDELPPAINIEGAPRSITEDETHSMSFLGFWPSATFFYKLNPSGGDIQFDKPATESERRTSVSRRALKAKKKLRNELDSNPLNAACFSGVVNSYKRPEPPTTRRPLPPSGAEPDLGRKVYCTHWIRTGECDYLQQGCLYKHEIPDRKTLGEIGISKPPTWHRKRNDAPVTAESTSLGVGLRCRSNRWSKHHRAKSSPVQVAKEISPSTMQMPKSRPASLSAATNVEQTVIDNCSTREAISAQAPSGSDALKGVPSSSVPRDLAPENPVISEGQDQNDDEELLIDLNSTTTQEALSSPSTSAQSKSVHFFGGCSELQVYSKPVYHPPLFVNVPSGPTAKQIAVEEKNAAMKREHFAPSSRVPLGEGRKAE